MIWVLVEKEIVLYVVEVDEKVWFFEEVLVVFNFFGFNVVYILEEYGG